MSTQTLTAYFTLWDHAVVVITALDLSPEDRQQLNGSVERILLKGAYSRDGLWREVRDLVMARLRT